MAVVDHGGFTAAAKATFVSQPALSFRINELEADLGTALFDRIGQKVQLTAAGAACWDRPSGTAGPRNRSGHGPGRFRTRVGVLFLACLPTLAADPTATLVGRFRSHHPGVPSSSQPPKTSRSSSNSSRPGPAN